MQLSSVRAVITGGVSGLGLAVARHLVAHGGKAALFDVNDDKGAAAVAELGEANVRYFRTDVTDEAVVAANIAAAKDALGGLNAAINCAGILGAGRVLGKEAPMPLANFQTTVMVNLVGSFNVAKAAADLMQHNAPNGDGERGVIVNTASVAAYEGQIGQAAYSARQALVSSRRSFQAGSRTQLDVLNAEQALAQAMRDLAQGRLSYLQAQLQLALHAGHEPVQAMARIRPWFSLEPTRPQSKPFVAASK